jgi:hypothetical protein
VRAVNAHWWLVFARVLRRSPTRRLGLSCFLLTLGLWIYSRTRMETWVLRVKDSTLVIEPATWTFFLRPTWVAPWTEVIAALAILSVIYVVVYERSILVGTVGGGTVGGGPPQPPSPEPPKKGRILMLAVSLIALPGIAILSAVGVAPETPPPDSLGTVSVPSRTYESVGWDATVTLVGSSDSVEHASMLNEKLQMELLVAGVDVAGDLKQVHLPTDSPLLYLWNCNAKAVGNYRLDLVLSAIGQTGTSRNVASWSHTVQVVTIFGLGLWGLRICEAAGTLVTSILAILGIVNWCSKRRKPKANGRFSAQP